MGVLGNHWGIFDGQLCVLGHHWGGFEGLCI